LIIDKCNKAYKPVITATQMLESMIYYPRPTRAEVTDVANAIYDGTDAIMLSGETAVGKYPVEAVTLMSQVAQTTETHFDAERFIRHRVMEEDDNISSAVCIASVRTARNVNAKAIIIPTQFGQTARLMSNFRPTMPMIAVTPNSTVQRRMMAYWGVTPIIGEQKDATQDIIQQAIDRAKEFGLVKAGDLCVITAGDPVTNDIAGVGHVTNMMYVIEVK
ncbi:MAG: pyruvate kinase, partial [bacterium]